jgi:toxin-antitoxin system PIN domain toxin
MIGVDTNILVYAHRRDSPWHERAAGAIRRLAEGNARWALPWPCVHEFFAIVTHARIYDPPSTPDQAIAQLDAWFECPTLEPIGEELGYWDNLRDVLQKSKVAGLRVHDARLAAICLMHGVRELWTADRDFSRFKQIATKNPLLP